MPASQIQYSERYSDDYYEYRHVILPSDISSLVPRSHLMSETEWRNLGVQQSTGWQHFMIHRPEPHVLLFRRPKDASTAPQAAADAAQTAEQEPLNAVKTHQPAPQLV